LAHDGQEQRDGQGKSIMSPVHTLQRNNDGITGKNTRLQELTTLFTSMAAGSRPCTWLGWFIGAHFLW